jgi:hypothetical protein
MNKQQLTAVGAALAVFVSVALIDIALGMHTWIGGSLAGAIVTYSMYRPRPTS